jgi:CRP-like cAMP-binding protein
VAITDCELSRIDGRVFLERFVQYPELRDEVLRGFALWLRHDADLAATVVGVEGKRRLALTLLDLCEQLEPSTDGPAGQVELPIGQADLAALADTSRESVSRALSAWKRTGIVARRGYRSYVIDTRRLRREIGLESEPPDADRDRLTNQQRSGWRHV